jgi:hypothetical protein
MPTRLSLVGKTAGVPDPRGAATWVIRRFTTPVPYANVWLDFSGCSDLRLSGDGLPPGQTLDCSGRIVSGVTDMSGTVTFDLVGAGAGAAGTLPGCLKVYANGMPLTSPVVSAFDLDGRNGVDLLDLSVAYGDVVSGQYRPRSDYDANGRVDLLDLSNLLGVMRDGASSNSGDLCP